MKRTLWLSLPVGVLGAHGMSYVLAISDDTHRDALLSATGHGYFDAALVFAAVGGCIALAVRLVAGLRERDCPSWRATALSLAAAQVGGFFVVEALERFAAGVSPLAGPARVFVVGAVVQIAIAVVAATVLVGAQRTAAAIGRAIRRCQTFLRFSATRLLSVSAGAARWTPIGTSAPRAPPFLLVAT